MSKSEELLLAHAVRRRAEVAGATALDTITLDREARFRRRVRLTTDGGRALLLDLAEATYLAEGDALVTEDGLVLVRAAAEPLMEVHARDALHLARMAWHLGNRHTPAEITEDAIYLQPDHVLEEMVVGLGGHVHHVLRPFEPEGGAYGGHRALEKGHHHAGHVHDHPHDHGHAHDPADDHAHGHPHTPARSRAALRGASRVWKGGKS